MKFKIYWKTRKFNAFDGTPRPFYNLFYIGDNQGDPVYSLPVQLILGICDSIHIKEI